MSTKVKGVKRGRVLSHSEVSTLSNCQMQHDLAYSGQVLGHTLKPRTAAPILRDGRAWGAAAAEYHATGNAGLAQIALLNAIDEDAEQMREAGVFVQEDYDAQREELLAILEHYTRTTEPIGGDRPEHQLVVALPSRGGIRRSNRYSLDCRIDLVKTDEYGRDWIVEFKLRGQLTPLAILVLSQQIRWYAWAWKQQTGRDIAGVIVEERFKAAPKPPRMVLDKKQSDAQKQYKAECKAAGTEVDKDRLKELANRVPSHAVDQLCEAHEYEGICRQHGVEPLDDVIAVLAARRWQQQETVFFRDDELAEVGLQLVSAAKQIHAFDTGDQYPLRNASSRVCGGCKFKDICADPHSEEVDMLFERRPAKRDAVQEVAA